MLQENLNKVLVFNKLEPALQRKVVSEMYERSVPAGEILIKEGDSGLAASELYVVKSGKFEVRGRAACQQEGHASLLQVHTASSCWCGRQHADAVVCTRTARTAPRTLVACNLVLDCSVCRCCSGGKASTSASTSRSGATSLGSWRSCTTVRAQPR